VLKTVRVAYNVSMPAVLRTMAGKMYAQYEVDGGKGSAISRQAMVIARVPQMKM
jgi:hypothetical protein